MFIMKLINCNKKKKIFYLNKSGNHDRDFTYINDVKIICHKMITKRIKPIHYIFNVCRGKTENIKRISKKIMKIYPETKIKNIKANKADVLKTFGSNKKIVEFLGFKKFTDINIGLKNLVEWFEKNKIEKYI